MVTFNQYSLGCLTNEEVEPVVEDDDGDGDVVDDDVDDKADDDNCENSSFSVFLLSSITEPSGHILFSALTELDDNSANNI